MTGPDSTQQFARVLASIPLIEVEPIEPIAPEFYQAPDDVWNAEMTRLYGENWETME